MKKMNSDVEYIMSIKYVQEQVYSLFMKGKIQTRNTQMNAKHKKGREITKLFLSLKLSPCLHKKWHNKVTTYFQSTLA